MSSRPPSGGSENQFREQAPGPRGSPQLPQAPPPDEGAHPVAPTAKPEICFSSFSPRQAGQAGVVEGGTILVVLILGAGALLLVLKLVGVLG